MAAFTGYYMTAMTVKYLVKCLDDIVHRVWYKTITWVQMSR